jgi:hypothetical protein
MTSKLLLLAAAVNHAHGKPLCLVAVMNHAHRKPLGGITHAFHLLDYEYATYFGL